MGDWISKPENRDLLVVFFTGATAVLLLVATVIQYNSFQHNKVATGRKRPLSIGRVKHEAMFIPSGDWRDDDQPDHTAVREVWMKILNRSGVPQVATFTKFRVVWPRRHRGFAKWFHSEEIPVPAYGGGAFKFYAQNHDWINASELEKQRLSEEPRYRCLTYVTLQTTSGHRTRYLGFLEFGMTIYHPRRGKDGQLLDGFLDP